MILWWDTKKEVRNIQTNSSSYAVCWSSFYTSEIPIIPYHLCSFSNLVQMVITVNTKPNIHTRTTFLANSKPGTCSLFNYGFHPHMQDAIRCDTIRWAGSHSWSWTVSSGICPYSNTSTLPSRPNKQFPWLHSPEFTFKSIFKWVTVSFLLKQQHVRLMVVIRAKANHSFTSRSQEWLKRLEKLIRTWVAKNEFRKATESNWE